MGYFSEMALNKQEELGLPAEQVSAGNAGQPFSGFPYRGNAAIARI